MGKQSLSGYRFGDRIRDHYADYPDGKQVVEWVDAARQDIAKLEAGFVHCPARADREQISALVAELSARLMAAVVGEGE